MHARISMSEREDRSIAHARDECARRVLFFSDIIGKYGSTSYIGMTRKKNGGQ